MQVQTTLTAPTPKPSTGPSLGPRERLILCLALLSIAFWGFNGSWEFPTVETVRGIGSAPGSTRALAAAPGQPSRGEKLFEANGCYACHSVNGEAKIGPTLLDIAGETVALSDGSSTTVDEAYLLESILHPQAKLVAGYEEAAMPSYEGLISKDEAQALVDYINSLR